MTEKNIDNRLNNDTRSVGIHDTITSPDEIDTVETDNSNWWLFFLILIMIGFVFVYLLGSGALSQVRP